MLFGEMGICQKRQARHLLPAALLLHYKKGLLLIFRLLENQDSKINFVAFGKFVGTFSDVTSQTSLMDENKVQRAPSFFIVFFQE